MTKKRARTPAAMPAKAPAQQADPKPLPNDVAIVHGATEDGEGARVLRFREGAVFAGEVRPVREGEPLDGHEVVRLKPIQDRSPLCEVEVLHAPPARRRQASGPARVATHSYRRNWSAIFGSSSASGAGKKRSGLLN